MNMARECIILNVKANTEQQWTHHGITQHCNDEYTSTTNNTALLGCHSVSSWNKCVNTSLKPRTHRRQSWIQHGPLCWKSTMLLWPRTQYTLATKLTISATKSTVSATKSTAPSVELELLPICCHIDNKVDRMGNSRLCCRFVAGFGNSQLSTKSTVLNSTLSPVCTGLNTTQHNYQQLPTLHPLYWYRYLLVTMQYTHLIHETEVIPYTYLP